MGRLHSLLLLLASGGARTAGGARNRLNCMAHASRSTPFFLTPARSSSGRPQTPQKPVPPAVKSMPKVRPNRAWQPSDIQTFTGLSPSLFKGVDCHPQYWRQDAGLRARVSCRASTITPFDLVSISDRGSRHYARFLRSVRSTLVF